MDTYQLCLAAQLDTSNGMLSVDESSFVKKGTHSIGVKRQYCGRLGKRENCQAGVFLAYAGDRGYGLVDRDLYIPQDWFEPSHDSLRRECHLPPGHTFATKNQIALRMLNQALGSGRFHVQWIGCDAAYGSKGPILAQRELLRCISCRADGSRNHVKPGPEIWLYIRRYWDGQPGTGPCGNAEMAHRAVL